MLTIIVMHYLGFSLLVYIYNAVRIEKEYGLETITGLSTLVVGHTLLLVFTMKVVTAIN